MKKLHLISFVWRMIFCDFKNISWLFREEVDLQENTVGGLRTDKLMVKPDTLKGYSFYIVEVRDKKITKISFQFFLSFAVATLVDELEQCIIS